MNDAKNVSRQIADWLVAQDIEQVFMVTGGGAMFLNHALGSHPKLKCTFMHHEQACAMAAEAYARVAGKPAVVNVTTGPAGINTLNGVFGAWTDSVPMLVISGQIKRETCLDFVSLPGLRQLGDQEGPVIHMARHVCKFVALAREPQDLAHLLPQALATAVGGRPGPAWIDIPLDIQAAPTALEFAAAPAAPALPACAAAGGEILARLHAAHRPLILAGSGVRCANAVAALRAFAEKTGIPVATAWTHDLIASDHPLCAGRPGTIGTRAGNFILQAADFVLVVGSRLNIRQVSYNYPAFARNAFIAQVDIDPAEFAKPFVKPQLTVVADARDFLETLLRLAPAAALPDFSPWATWCRSLRTRFPGIPQEAGALNPYAVVAHIFKRLRPEDVIVCGNASACIVPFQVGELQDGQRMFSNSGSASMGYDLPAALGAAQAAPERRVVCFAGDGSLQMNIQELQTLQTCGANVVVIVLANQGYLSIRLTHENFFGSVVGATRATGVDFPDFAAVATAYGVPALRVGTADDMAALDAALALDGPRLIQLDVTPEQEFEPRLKSRMLPDGTFATPELDDMYPFLQAAERDAVRAEGQAIRARMQSAG